MGKDLSRKLTDFDAGLHPDNPQNVEAAEERGWKYDAKTEYYVDKDGCLMADKYGQPLG